LKHIELLERLEAIKEIEQENGKKVITFYRNAENNRGLIDERSYREFSAAIDSIGNYDPLMLIIHTMGGSIYYGWRIANCLMNRVGPVTVVVPEEALSTGTLVTLTASEIIMFPRAQLSPVDPQIPHKDELVPALDLIDSPDILIKKKGKGSVGLTEEYLNKICKSKVPNSKLNMVVERFLRKDSVHKGHAASIFFDEIKELELPVRQLTIDSVKSLHTKYQRHSFNNLDSSTIIEYTHDPLTKDKTLAWEKVRNILEYFKSGKFDLEETQELLKNALDENQSDFR